MSDFAQRLHLYRLALRRANAKLRRNGLEPVFVRASKKRSRKLPVDVPGQELLFKCE